MLKIRLCRKGNRNRPFYRVVVSDSRRTPTARTLEELGYYDPADKPEAAKLELGRIEHWRLQGAKLSPTVQRLVNRQQAPAS